MTTELNTNNIPETEGLTTPETETTAKKGKKRNGRGYKAWQKKVMNRGFKLIDKRFKQREEILPGIITQSAPISGQVQCDVHFEAHLFYNSMKMALERWSLSVGYQELRSLKGLNGLTSSVSDQQCVAYTSKVLTICAFCMLNAPNKERNFGVYLMNLGLGRLVLPSLYLDLLHISTNLNAYHQPKFMETSSMLFSIKSLTRNSKSWKDMDAEFEDVYKKFGQWEIPFLECYNYLSRFTQLTNIMSTSEIDIYALTTTASAYFFNCIRYSKERETREMLVGRGANQRDILLAVFINYMIAETDLKSYHLDGFVYMLPVEKAITGLKRGLLQEYFGIEDTFVSPSTTACKGDYSKTLNESITEI